MSDVRAIAFGGNPASTVSYRPDAPAVQRWLGAVALGAQGRYGAAAAELARLVRDPATPQAIVAHAVVTRAAHRRQLGGHAGARRGDGLGLRLADEAARRAQHAEPDADGTDAAAARIDALIGLAADAVGLGEPLVAHRLLDSARSRIDDHPSWRLRVRSGWVGAELALLRGRPGDALEPASAAMATASAAGAQRHLVKSRIVHVVSAFLAGEREVARVVDELDDLAGECERLRLQSLRWPCLLAAADLLGQLGGTANDDATRMAQLGAEGALSAATRRRHAAMGAMSAIEGWSDPVIRRLAGVSMRRLGSAAVM